MKGQHLKGMSFGLTSSTITNLGLVIGLDASTHMKLAVIGAIFVVAIADGLSDALSMHISEESENHHTPREIWDATFATFFAKFFVTLTFAVPLLLLPIDTATIIAAAWGLTLIGVLSYYIGKKSGEGNKVITEHIFIAMVVIVLSKVVGTLVGYWFG
jgi:hypothetical protein